MWNEYSSFKKNQNGQRESVGHTQKAYNDVIICLHISSYYAAYLKTLSTTCFTPSTHFYHHLPHHLPIMAPAGFFSATSSAHPVRSWGFRKPAEISNPSSVFWVLSQLEPHRGITTGRHLRGSDAQNRKVQISACICIISVGTPSLLNTLDQQ